MSVTAKPIVNLSRDEVKAGMESGTFVLVDVREPHEFASGHIPGSVSMPLSHFDIEALRKMAAPVIFSCAAGVRSLNALYAARDAGLDINSHYAGGFRDWLMAGEPVVTR